LLNIFISQRLALQYSHPMPPLSKGATDALPNKY